MPQQSNSAVFDLDSYADSHMYDHVADALTDALNDINPGSTQYTSRGENVGWQNTHGTTTVTLTDGRDLLQKLTPDSDWYLTATIYDDRIVLDLSHHDSPTGETHTLTPA